MHKITRPVNTFQNVQPRLTAVSGVSQEIIKFRIFSKICSDCSYVL